MGSWARVIADLDGHRYIHDEDGCWGNHVDDSHAESVELNFGPVTLTLRPPIFDVTKIIGPDTSDRVIDAIARLCNDGPVRPYYGDTYHDDLRRASNHNDHPGPHYNYERCPHDDDACAD